jgi:hypothetical protein
VFARDPQPSKVIAPLAEYFCAAAAPAPAPGVRFATTLQPIGTLGKSRFGSVLVHNICVPVKCIVGKPSRLLNVTVGCAEVEVAVILNVES